MQNRVRNVGKRFSYYLHGLGARGFQVAEQKIDLLSLGFPSGYAKLSFGVKFFSKRLTGF